MAWPCVFEVARSRLICLWAAMQLAGDQPRTKCATAWNFSERLSSPPTGIAVAAPLVAPISWTCQVVARIISSRHFLPLFCRNPLLFLKIKTHRQVGGCSIWIFGTDVLLLRFEILVSRDNRKIFIDAINSFSSLPSCFAVVRSA